MRLGVTKVSQGCVFLSYDSRRSNLMLMSWMCFKWQQGVMRAEKKPHAGNTRSPPLCVSSAVCGITVKKIQYENVCLSPALSVSAWRVRYGQCLQNDLSFFHPLTLALRHNRKEAVSNENIIVSRDHPASDAPVRFPAASVTVV